MHLLTELINKGVGKAMGFRIQRLPKTVALTQAHRRDTSMVVEFMGASGVGKTTLRDFYLKTYGRSLKDHVMTEADLSRFTIDLKKNDFPQMEIYNRIFSIKLIRMGEKRDSLFRNKRRFKMFLDTLIADCKIRYFMTDHIFFLDQHVFKFFTTDFLSLEDSEIQKELLKNRIIIYCYASPETMMEFIKKRTQEGTTRLGHQGKSEEEIFASATAHWDESQEEIRRLKASGAALLEIDTGDGLQENAVLIREFIQEHRRDKS